MPSSKPFHPDDMAYDLDGEFNLADTLDNSISNRARGPLPDNPPPGPKWQAKQGLCRLNLNGAEYAVLGCLIDRASKTKGGLLSESGIYQRLDVPAQANSRECGCDS